MPPKRPASGENPNPGTVRSPAGVNLPRTGYATVMDDQPSTPLQNDPDRASGSLVPDAVGEFVREQPGGAFDPRSFRGDREPIDAGPEADAAGAAEPVRPPVDDERMSGPGDEIDKTR